MPTDTLRNSLPGFIDSLTQKGRSPSTVLAYRADLEQLLLYLQEKNVVTPEAVRATELEGFRDSLLAKKYTPKSVSRKLNATKTYFRFLKDSKMITFDPSSHVAHPKIEVTKPKFLSQIEYRALRDIVRGDPRIVAIVELILQTGIRISEVANLKLTDIGDKIATIRAYATQPERVVPLNTHARAAIDNYLPHRPKNHESEYLFVSKNGKPLAVRNIRAAIDRYLQRADISDYSVNDIRTTFIIENLKAGVDLVLLSQVTGHKRLSTTERYLEIAGVESPGKKQVLEEL